MEGRYYTENLSGLDLVVLDGNEIPKKSKSFILPILEANKSFYESTNKDLG